MTRVSKQIIQGLSVVLAVGSYSLGQAQEANLLSDITQPLSVQLSSLAEDTELVSYSIEVDGKRVNVDIGELARELSANDRLNPEDDSFLTDVIEQYSSESWEGMAGIAAALRDGGMHALAGEELLAFVAGAQECVNDGDILLPRDDDGNPRPRLVRSAMDLHFNIGSKADGSHFGRGQFDVSSIKVLFCVKVSDPANSYPIIVDRRWVINVGDEALRSDTDVEFPPNSGTVYPFQLSARGVGIELVSYYVSGVRQPRTRPLYDVSSNSCIDIFFNIVPTPDQPVLISKPGDLVFCAGGACGDQPPKLDATQ